MAHKTSRETVNIRRRQTSQTDTIMYAFCHGTLNEYERMNIQIAPFPAKVLTVP